MSKGVFYIPAGPKNLATLFPDINWSTTGSYVIEVIDTDDDVIATLPRYDVVKCCDDDVRMVFLNYPGGTDEVNGEVTDIEQDTKSDSARRPTSYPLVKTLHGLSRINIKSNDTYSAVVIVREEKLKWLEELLNSPLAWIEWKGVQGQADSHIPIVILDKKFVKKRWEDRYEYQVTVDFILSHEKVTIRN